MEDKLQRHGLPKEVFSGMKVRPFEHKGPIMESKDGLFSNLDSWKLLFQLYPEDAEALCRYIVYMYDQDTPMLKLFPNIVDRKRVSSDLAGLTSKNIQKMLAASGISAAHKAIFDYLKAQRSSLWTLIIVNESMFYECMDNMLQDTKMDKDKDLLASLKIKSELAEHMEKTQNRMQKYIKQFYNDDVAMESVHNVISQRMSSESIAEQISSRNGG